MRSPHSLGQTQVHPNGIFNRLYVWFAQCAQEAFQPPFVGSHDLINACHHLGPRLRSHSLPLAQLDFNNDNRYGIYREIPLIHPLRNNEIVKDWRCHGRCTGLHRAVSSGGLNIMLELSDFTIGREFWTETGRWRCTDVGTRTLCAIKLDGDTRNWIGPPYSIVEHVFDETDFGALYASASEVPD